MNQMSIVPNLAEAAKALVEIDQAGELPALGDEIRRIYRNWKRDNLDRKIGEKLYIDQLVKILTAQGVDQQDAWTAISDAVRPSWPSVLFETIIKFAAQSACNRRRSA